MNEETDRTPTYQPPGIPMADPKDAKGIVRMINKMLKPKMKMPRIKGLQSDQTLHIKHKKIRYY